jgi:hypothetical protein
VSHLHGRLVQHSTPVGSLTISTSMSTSLSSQSHTHPELQPSSIAGILRQFRKERAAKRKFSTVCLVRPPAAQYCGCVMPRSKFVFPPLPAAFNAEFNTRFFETHALSSCRLIIDDQNKATAQMSPKSSTQSHQSTVRYS